MFEDFPPSKSQLNNDFLNLPLMFFAEMNEKEILCIVCTVKLPNCANYEFNIRKKYSEINSDPFTTKATDKVNSSFFTCVSP